MGLFEKAVEINRNFRNHGLSARPDSESTILMMIDLILVLAIERSPCFDCHCPGLCNNARADPSPTQPQPKARNMLEPLLINGYAFWLLLGLVLLISEFFAPGLVALFFGVGALLVGVLTLLGLVDSLTVQLLLFALISVGTLFGLRRHFKRWMHGDETTAENVNPDNIELIGKRVKVLTAFKQGAGHVQLNGAKWDAESGDALEAGDSAWILSHSGILLKVTATPPDA